MAWGRPAGRVCDPAGLEDLPKGVTAKPFQAVCLTLRSPGTTGHEGYSAAAVRSGAAGGCGDRAVGLAANLARMGQGGRG
jgi:hypothetical protein